MVDSPSWRYDRLMPGALAVLALMGAINQQASLMALASTVLFTLLLTRYWSHRSTHALLYERQISDNRAFAGDELTMELRLSNDKLLPLSWVEVDDRVPGQLALTSEDGTGNPNRDGCLRLAGSVSWKERVTWRYRMRCQHRGIYPLGPAVITSGDPFGFFPRSRTLGEVEKLVVYPRLVPLERFGLPSGFPLGDAKPRKWIFEDPARTVGVRDYRREDSFRRIHWKATARRQQLQVKVHEPTTTLEVVLFLGLDTFGPDGETGGRGDEDAENPESRTQNPELDSALSTQHSALDFEYAVSVVASLAHQLVGQRYPVGLYLNGGIAGSQDVVELAPGGSQEQLIGILELLAGVERLPNVPVETLLSRVAPRLPWGSSIIVVVGSASEPLLATLRAVARQGQRPVVLSVGDARDLDGGNGLMLHHLRREGVAR